MARNKEKEKISTPTTEEVKTPDIENDGASVEKKGGDTVVVKKTDLDNLLSRLDKYQKDIELLFKASDKNRIAKALNQDGKILIHTVKVSRWDDTNKYVIGWKLLTNKAEVVMGRYTEDQTTNVFFDDGEPIVVPLLEFYRKTIKKDDAEVVSRETKTDPISGDVTELLKVRFPNGRELVINNKFIN